MEVDGEITGDKTEEKKEDEEGLDETRLYVMNLPFNVTDSDLRELFGKFGDIEEIQIPLGRQGRPLGFAFVKFKDVECAIEAFADRNKKFYQGRRLHIMPAQKRVIKSQPREEFYKDRVDGERKFDKPSGAQTSVYKEELEEKLKADFED